MLSLSVTTSGIAFFFLYANGFDNWPMTLDYVPGESDAPAALGVLSTLSSTLILAASVLLVLRRWLPPADTFTLVFTAVGVFMAGLDAHRHWWQIAAPVVGGLVADAVIAGRSRIHLRAWACGALVPLAMWTTSTVATHLAWEVRWPPELWAGAVVMAMLAGFALALVAFPPPSPRAEPAWADPGAPAARRAYPSPGGRPTDGDPSSPPAPHQGTGPGPGRVT